MTEELREAIVNFTLSETCSPGRKYISIRRKEAFAITNGQENKRK